MLNTMMFYKVVDAFQKETIKSDNESIIVIARFTDLEGKPLGASTKTKCRFRNDNFSEAVADAFSNISNEVLIRKESPSLKPEEFLLSRGTGLATWTELMESRICDALSWVHPSAQVKVFVNTKGDRLYDAEQETLALFLEGLWDSHMAFIQWPERYSEEYNVVSRNIKQYIDRLLS